MAEDMQPRMLLYHGITKLRTTTVEVLAWRAVEDFEWRPVRDKDVQPGRLNFQCLTLASADSIPNAVSA